MTTGQKTILAIVGATASGKSALAQKVAAESGASLVSVDSRKIYRGMDIGTAKPTPALQKEFRYGMIDCADPDQPFSAGDYAALARPLIQKRLDAGESVILVGGTGFYLEALLHGLADLPSIAPEIRRTVEDDAARLGWEAIHAEIRQADPEWADTVHPSDQTRLRRAAEILRQTGQPYSVWLTERQPEPVSWNVLTLELVHPRTELLERITMRTDRMLAAGLREETAGLLARGYDRACPGMATVGYTETLAHLAGEIDEREWRELIIVHTRRYAKRQRTWFRHRPYIRAIESQPKVWQHVMSEWADFAKQ